MHTPSFDDLSENAQNVNPSGLLVSSTTALSTKARRSDSVETGYRSQHALLLDSRMAFSVKETAAILGLSEKTVRRLVNRNLLRASRALRHLLIPKKEIQRFLDETMSK